MKICNKCKIEKDFTFFYRLKGGWYQSYCNPCRALLEKERREKKLKEDKDFYKKQRLKYGQKENLMKRERYQSDTEYRVRQLEYDRKYNASGRRKKLYVLNRERKLEIAKEQRIKHKDKIKAYQNKYRKENKEFIKQLDRDKIDNLKDSYVKAVLRKKSKIDSSIDIPNYIVELERNVLKFKRELKNKIKENDKTNPNL